MADSAEVYVSRVSEYTPEIAAGIGLLMPDLSVRLTAEPIAEDRLRRIIESPNHEQFIAEHQARIVGAATLNILLAPSVYKGYLEDFVVSSDESVRGKGVGYGLWQEMNRWCVERDITSIDFTSSYARAAAHEFYFRQGATILNTASFGYQVANPDAPVDNV